MSNKRFNPKAAGTAFAYLMGIIETIVSIVGLLSFFVWHNNTYMICAAVILVLAITNLILISQPIKGAVIASILGVVWTRSIISGVCLGLCVESAIMMILGWIMRIAKLISK